MSEFGPSPVQGFLGHFALGYVLERADEERMTGDALHHVRYSADMLDRARDGHDAERKRDVLPSHAAGNDRFERRQIIRVNDVADPLHGHLRAGFETEDPKRLLGPLVIVTQQIRDEAPGVAESLSIG